jgi:preprotein translocase subunit SecG
MKKLILLLITLFLIASVFAQEELLLQINLFDDGSALIMGSSTINPNIQEVEYEKVDQTFYGYTQHLTNKIGITWTFSLELEQDFSNNYIKIILPENSKLGPVSSDLESFVTTEDGNIVIEFVGEDKVAIEFDYELETQAGEKGFDFIYIIIFIVIVIILIISIISFLKEKRKKKIEKKETKTEKKKPNKKNPLKTVMSTLNEI